jgi:hypothetical protein
MDIRSFLIANSQSAKLMKPTICAFHNPPINTQAAAMFGISFGEHRFDPATPQSLAMAFGIIRTITLSPFGTSSLSAFATNFRNRIYQGNQLRHIMCIGSRQGRRHGDAVGIGKYVMLRAGFAAIRGIGARFRPPKTARTDVLSTTTRDQSICLASSNLWSNTPRIFSHTPASCQSRSRRQHVMPEPQPISLGRYSQGMPVLRTNNIPVSTERLSFGFRPGFRCRRFLGAGSSGSSSFHNSSFKMGCAIIVPPCTARQYNKNTQVAETSFC